MTDAFLLGAGFSKAVCKTMPTMMELYKLLNPLVGKATGISNEAYEYASGNVETLLSYYAIPGPHDDPVERLRKQWVTRLLEDKIGQILQQREDDGTEQGPDRPIDKLVSKWHEHRTHVLTTNYDTIVEQAASDNADVTSGGGLSLAAIYPVPIANASARDREGVYFAPGSPDTFMLYKLHGSTTWYKSSGDTTFDPIYRLTNTRASDPSAARYVADKRRFIVPPVYDKSSLLSHESIRSIWEQAKNKALRQADTLYVMGYSLPETDVAMHTLLWEGTRTDSGASSSKKILYVVDIDNEVIQRYVRKLGRYYDVRDCYAGGDGAFDEFVEAYVGNA